MQKTAVILTNIGSPNNCTVKDVKQYLSVFLGDRRVINLPYVARKTLVNAIIVPFRASKSTKLYQKLWTKDGSPLIVHNQKLASLLNQQLGDTYSVFSAMRYGKPSLQKTLDSIVGEQYKKVIIIPLFPQYASSTSGSIMEFCTTYFKPQINFPSISLVSQFYAHPLFIKAFAANIRLHQRSHYDHILFSYHGLPLKQVYNSHKGYTCSELNCTNEINASNNFCYHATCYATTRLLAKELNIEERKYTVCFQSRFAKKWLSPFTDEVIRYKAKEGAKRLLVVSPAFVADCLETIVEIGDEYQQLFIESGGTKLQLVDSLNSSPLWVEALADIVKNN